MTREELMKLSEEDLDELVHDLKGEEAARINNRGKEAQVDYILMGKEQEDAIYDIVV